jgi:hypothetical protein
VKKFWDRDSGNRVFLLDGTSTIEKEWVEKLCTKWKKPYLIQVLQNRQIKRRGLKFNATRYWGCVKAEYFLQEINLILGVLMLLLYYYAQEKWQTKVVYSCLEYYYW